MARNEKNLSRALAAEFIGTFMLVFAGTGAVVTNAMHEGALGHFGISLVFGLVIMVSIFAFGHISGGHFNPAVTLGFTLTNNFPLKRLLPYWLAQFTGAIIGSFAVAHLIGFAGLGVTQPSIPVTSALIVEALLTFLLMIVIMAVATDSRAVGKAAAVAVGGTIALAALLGGPLTGASLNPARSLAPALVAGNFSFLYIYFIGPLFGAAVGAIVYKWIGRTNE